MCVCVHVHVGLYLHINPLRNAVLVGSWSDLTPFCQHPLSGIRYQDRREGELLCRTRREISWLRYYAILAPQIHFARLESRTDYNKRANCIFQSLLFHAIRKDPQLAWNVNSTRDFHNFKIHDFLEFLTLLKYNSPREKWIPCLIIQNLVQRVCTVILWDKGGKIVVDV